MSRRDWEEPIIWLDDVDPLPAADVWLARLRARALARDLLAVEPPVVPEPIWRECLEAREYLALDAETPATWERDLLRAIDAAQRALVLVRGRR